MKVRLAGGLGLEADGQEIALPRSRRARGVLAYLAAHPGPHARAELAARFWPDVLDESARTSLRAALTELRAALGEHAVHLVATRESVVLEGAEVDIGGDGELLAGMDDEWVHDLRRARAEQAASDMVQRLAGAAVPSPAALARAEEQPFVGRARERARLTAVWAQVRAQRSRRLVLLAGEPGIGKTRLALHAASAAHRDGAAVLLGRCSEDPLAPYEPFTEILRQLGSDPLSRAESHAADAGARHRLFAAVDDVLTAVAERRPAVLVLDDLHWADRPTLVLFGFLLRGARPASLLVIGTYRDTEVGRRTPLAGALADLRRDGGAERIGLRGLEAADVAELAAARLGADAAARVASAVHARTEGNAFFVEEVLRGLAEDDASVPESVRHAVGTRLARLEPAAEDLLALAAVLGQVVDPAILADLGGDEAALEELLDAGLLRAGAAFEFTHALVREAVLAEINPLRLARLHRAAADALAARSEERHVEEIAHHLSAAADPRAPEFLRRAGERAMRMLAYEEAAESFARALEAVDGAQAGPLLLARGDALMRAGEVAAARAVLQQAAAAARAAGDARVLARAALAHAGLGIAIIDLDAPAIELLEEALATLAGADPVLESELLGRLAVELYYAPARDRSEDLSERAVAVARRCGDARATAAALNARHVALWRPDRLDERLATADAMIEAAQRAGDAQLELQGRNWRVVDLFERGDMAELRAEAERHGALAHDLRLPAFAWYTPLWAAAQALLAGRYEEAAELRERARAQGNRAGDRNAELFAEMLRFNEVIQRGTWEDMNVALLEEKIATSPSSLSWRSSYAWLLAATGRPGAARDQLEMVLDLGIPFDTNWATAMGEGAEAAALLGDPLLAARIYEELLPYAGVTLTAGRAVVSLGSTERLLAGLARSMGREEEAVQRHRAGIRRNDAMGFSVWADAGRAALAR